MSLTSQAALCLVGALSLGCLVTGSVEAVAGEAAPAESSATGADTWASVPALRDSVPWPVGVAIDEREMSGVGRDVTLRHFDQLTAENAMKPAYIWRDPAVTDWRRWSWAGADTYVDFARANNMRVYGHTLIWHQQMPDWFYRRTDGTPFWDTTSNSCTPSEAADATLMRARIKTYIDGVASHFLSKYGDFGSAGNPIVAFDVVNEAIDNTSDHFRHAANPLYCVLGTEYLEYSLRVADAAFRNADGDRTLKLFINDYNTEWSWKSDDQLAVVSDLVSRGVPLDGVGHQMHLSLRDRDTLMQPQNITRTLDQLAPLGVDQAVTELDVGIMYDDNRDGILDPITQAELTSRLDGQGAFFADLFGIYRSHDLFSVSVWGINDARTWRTGTRPLLFDASYGVKPALVGALSNRPEIVVDLASTWAGEEGQRVDLDITYTGFPRGEVRWERRNSTTSPWTTVTQGPEATLSITASIHDHGAEYRAIVLTSRGTDISRSLALSVRPAATPTPTSLPSPPATPLPTPPEPSSTASPLASPLTSTSLLGPPSLRVSYGRSMPVTYRVVGATGGSVRASIRGWTGEVPVADDGSVSFRVPARTTLPGAATLTLSYSGSNRSAATTTSVPVRTVRARPELSVRHSRLTAAASELTVRVLVRAAGLHRRDLVTVTVDNRTYRVRLRGTGRGQARIDVPRAAGRHVVLVTYLGNDLVRKGSTRSRIKVVARQ